MGRIIEGYVRVAANLIREIEDDVPDAIEEEGNMKLMEARCPTSVSM